MPITIKTTAVKYKNPATGDYIGVDTLTAATADQIAAVQAAGTPLVEEAKKWATGEKLNGDPVASTDEQYENNAYYHSQQAAGSATAANNAKVAAEDARDAAQAAAGDFQGLTASVTGLAAGASPTVEATHSSGGLYNLAFGIPKGDKGDKGDTGNPAPAEQVTPAVNAYLEANFSNPSNPPLDRSLASGSSAAPADMVGDLNGALNDDEIAIFNSIGKIERRNFTIPHNTQLASIFNIDFTESVVVTFAFTLTSALDKNAWIYIKDASGNNLIPGGDKTLTAGLTSYSFDFTPAQNYKNAVLKFTTNASGATDAAFTSITAVVKNATIKPVWEVYKENGKAIEDLEERVSEQITDLENSLYDIVLGKNLFNPSTAGTGYIYDDGTIKPENNYTSSDFIEIENDKTYFFSARSNPNTSTLSSAAQISALYDENKDYISNSRQTGSSGLQIAVSNASAKYLRVSVRESIATYYMQVEEGTAAGDFEAYKETKALKLPLGEIPAEQVGEMIPDEVQVLFNKYEIPLVQTAQLFDRTKLTVGYCDNTGYINSSSGYVYTDKFAVTEGKTIYFSNNGVAKMARFVTAYNSSGSIVSASGAGSATYTYTVPTGIKEIRISYVNPASDSSYTNFQAEYDRITGYAKYGKYFNIDASVGNQNVLYGKKWVVCGDSFTAGVTAGTIPSGKYAGFKKTYPYFIGNRNSMDIVNFSEGGRTLAFPAEPGTFANSLTNPSNSNYYQNIPADADYITIYLGINDCSHANGSSQDGEDTTGLIPLGEITDNTTATHYGAWNVVLTWLITNRPNAHIGILVTNGLTTNDNYRQAQIAIAKKYGIPYIDLNGDERTPAMIRTSNPNIPSAIKNALIEKWEVSSTNTHPNDAAHEFESAFIENFLRNI